MSTTIPPILTIIIPCYNCAPTLKEAIESCYRQGLSLHEFEIVMVNDCSTDETWSVMTELKEQYPNIRIYQHEKNQGGGAARNTATKYANANLVFCLDSDDILGPEMLIKMVRLQQQTNADGIGIETSIKFRGTDISDIAFVNVFGYRGEIVPLESLLQRDGVMCPLYSTFMYTKAAFEKIGGYPTDHGFDTQGIAWRFLRHGLTAYTCPDTVYYHRVNFNASYYIREHTAGKTNINWKRILLENNGVLSDEAFTFVCNFNERDFETDLITGLRTLPNVFTTTPKERVVNIDALVIKKPIHRNSWRGIFYRARRRLREFVSTVQ